MPTAMVMAQMEGDHEQAPAVAIGDSSSSGADQFHRPQHLETGDIEMGTTSTDAGDPLMLLDLPDREAAVAALSATLAFRRFDNLNGSNTSSNASNKNPSRSSSVISASAGAGKGDPLDSSGHSRHSHSGDHFEDSLRRLSSLLGPNNRAGAGGRPALETIVSGRNFDTANSLPNSLRGSLRSNYSGYASPGSGFIESLKRPPSFAGSFNNSITEENKVHGDDDSLDSRELREQKSVDKGDDNLGGDESMTISLLESKKLSAKYSHLDGTTASSDEEDDTSCESSHSLHLDLGNSDKKPPNPLVPSQSGSGGGSAKNSASDSGGINDTARSSESRGAAELASSLQRIFDNSKGSKASSVASGDGLAKEKEPLVLVPTRKPSSLKENGPNTSRNNNSNRIGRINGGISSSITSKASSVSGGDALLEDKEPLVLVPTKKPSSLKENSPNSSRNRNNNRIGRNNDRISSSITSNNGNRHDNNGHFNVSHNSSFGWTRKISAGSSKSSKSRGVRNSVRSSKYNESWKESYQRKVRQRARNGQLTGSLTMKKHEIHNSSFDRKISQGSSFDRKVSNSSHNMSVSWKDSFDRTVSKESRGSANSNNNSVSWKDGSFDKKIRSRRKGSKGSNGNNLNVSWEDESFGKKRIRSRPGRKRAEEAAEKSSELKGAKPEAKAARTEVSTEEDEATVKSGERRRDSHASESSNSRAEARAARRRLSVEAPRIPGYEDESAKWDEQLDFMSESKDASKEEATATSTSSVEAPRVPNYKDDSVGFFGAEAPTSTRDDNVGRNSWKDSSNLSSVLKNPSPRGIAKYSPLSMGVAGNNPSPRSIENDDGNGNAMIGYAPRLKKKARARVSWQIDDGDAGDELDEPGNNYYYPTAGVAGMDAIDASGRKGGGSLSDGSSSVRPAGALVNSLQSEATGVSSLGESIDFDNSNRDSDARLFSNRRKNRKDLATSLKADEQLLASMIHLANLRNSLQVSDSTWGNHISLSSGMSLKRKSSAESADADDSATDREVGVQGKGQEAAPSPASIQESEEDTCDSVAPKAPPAMRCIESDEDTSDSAAPKAPPARRILGQESLRRLVRETTPSGLTVSGASSSQTAAAVTRLAHQEVEDYRTRLQRKRASMEAMEGNTTSRSGNSGASSQEEADELNELLFENATNISNALLLQRALYTLRISGDGVNNSATAGSAAESATSNSNEVAASSMLGAASMPRSHSEHTGIDRMALNHFLNISGSATHSTPSASMTTPGRATNADWNPVTLPNASSQNSQQRPSNPFTALLNRRRNTYFEGAERASQPQQPPPAALQVGAYQSNEPAPLLYRRTYESGNQSRRERRAEARRNTLDLLARERASSSAAVATNRRINYNTDIFNSSGSTVTNPADRRRSSVSTGDDQPIVEEEAETATDATTTTAATTNEPQSVDDIDNVASAIGNDTPSCHNSSAASMRASRYNNILVASVRHAIATARPQGLVSSTGSYRAGEEGVDAADYQASHQNLRNWLRHSVNRQSFNSKRMLQAILVSDEIVEADHIETTLHDGTMSNQNSFDVEMVPTLQERIEMLEELLDERDEERRLMLETQQKRERVFAIGMVVAVLVIIGLIVVIATGVGP